MLLEMVDDIDALLAEAGWSMSQFIQSLVNRVCVDVASSTGARTSSSVARGLVTSDAVVWLRRNGCWVKLSWSAIATGCCVVFEELLNGRHSEVGPEKSCLNKKIRSDWFGWLCWVRGCDWLDSTSSPLAGGKNADPAFVSLVWWWGHRPHAADHIAGRGNSICLCQYLSPGPVFVSASHQTSLDKRSVTQKSIYSGGYGSRVRFEPRLEPCWTVLVI